MGNRRALALGTVVVNEGKQAENAKVSWKILDTSGKTVATADAPAQSIAADGSVTYAATAQLAEPRAMVGGCAQSIFSGGNG